MKAFLPAMTSARFLAVTLASAAFAITGCGIGSITTGSGGAGVDSAASLRGNVHGGNNPVSGAAVTLYEASYAGYGGASQEVTSVSVTNGGSGYTFAPTVTIAGTAAGTATINTTTGKVTGVTLTSRGSGYTTAPTISFSGGGGTGAAATANLGSGAIALATTSTDANGNFSFNLGTGTAAPNSTPTDNYSCDTLEPNGQIYIIATGGNTLGTGSTTNSAATFLAAIGACSAISNSTEVIMNELTTAATVYALAQYIYPGTTPGTATIGTGSSPQAATGLNNAVAGIANLANYSNGSLSAIAPVSYTGTGSAAGVTVTAVTDSPKLVDIANILSTCINSTSGASNQCLDLFNNATPPTNTTTSQPSATFGTAQDTLQAAYYLATNPGLNGTFSSCKTTTSATTKSACLFGLTTGTGAPFVGGTGSTAPTEYSLQIIYSATGTCSGGGAFIAGAYHAAIDAGGNVWFINGLGSDNMVEMSPVGKPLVCVGGSSTYPSGRGMTIDAAGNVWGSFNGTGGGVYELPNGSTTTASLVNWPIPGTPQPAQLTSDGFGNVFVNVYATGGSMYEWPAAAFASSASTANLVASGFNGTTTTTQGYMQVDSKGRIWDATSTADFLYGVYTLAAASAPITGISTSGTAATFTAANSFTSGQTVQISGLTSTTGQNFNFGTYTITAATATTFTIASSVTAANIADTGEAYLPASSQTAATSYAFTANATATTSSYGVVIDSSNNLYAGTTCCGTALPYREAEKFIAPSSINSGTLSTVAVPGVLDFAGMNGLRAEAVDGASNVFVGSEFGNSSGSTGTAGNWSISEYTAPTVSGTTTFTSLSPFFGTPATCSTSACPTLGGFFDTQGTSTYSAAQSTGSAEAFDMQIDPSGNVWYLDSGNNTTTTGGQSITEAVGIAVPVVTPLSLAVKYNQLGTKP
jgi:hypothetical protein